MSGSRRPLAKVGVLLSGRGSNFVALQEAMLAGEVPAEIVLVASNLPSAAGLAKARDYGLPTLGLSHRGMSRQEHEEKLIAALRAAGVGWVCLAGYMRLLSPRFVQAFPQRVLNIHPSLLPSFPGLDAQQQAWDHGVRVSGCTVHLVDEGLDSGPIVVQRVVAIDDARHPDEVAARILAEEHLAYPAALRYLLMQSWRLEGRRVVASSPEAVSKKPEKKP